ncbi:putative bifunctional diguanylate cyclase/phosphodiesterase [Parerythrobacter jejuensis]|uniref:putative bifunctional diguanylate cyclase/phosphodiesterase n=1 Tax=Parerythrobacter jejuensis TaxID=795812 RepID=UPI002D80757C|nr:EAL domain-containing protein [Parerythrobacter jejuensis]
MIKRQNGLEKARRDVVALGIAAAAIIMFVGTGSAVLPGIVQQWTSGVSGGTDYVLVNALLLNIALIIFGWRRYRELTVEITDRRVAEEKARELAEIDPLTGCLNRRAATIETDRAIALAAKGGKALAFIMVDLDNFKQVNDLSGHQTGDEVLVRAAERMSSLLPRDAILARLGGDEFAFVYPYEAHAPDRVEQFVSRLIDAVAKPMDVVGQKVEITMSVGIASGLSGRFGEKLDCDAQVLMHQADIAMYHAKKQGKNRFYWFEDTMENELRFRNQLETGIRVGVERGEFVPHYEQQVDIATGKLMGFEMLARWQSPKLGLVSPDIFIPIAEEIGVIGDMSESLMRQAFTDARDWDPSLTVSVNISPVQLRDPWFSQKILKLLVECNFPPQRLDIEITESCLHDNIGVVRSMITSLKNQGVKISLDDFGTGYSSLSQLRSLPFDRIKIDRSFVSELKDEDASSKIVSAIISLGNGLEMPITAEGIEDDRVLETLKGMGQMKGQGYLYGRPEAADQVRKRLSSAGLLVEPKAASDDTSDTPKAKPARKSA